LLDTYWESVLELGRMPRDDEFDQLTEVRQACGSLPRALQLFIDRFGEPTFAAARQRRKEDLLVFVAAAQLRRKIPFNQLSPRLQRDLRSFFGSYTNAEEKARELMFAAGDEDELEKRLFVTVIDHTTGPEHQLLFFKERFLAKDHPDRPKMNRFSAKLRKQGLRKKTIGYGPTKEKWEAHQRDRQEN